MVLAPRENKLQSEIKLAGKLTQQCKVYLLNTPQSISVEAIPDSPPTGWQRHCLVLRVKLRNEPWLPLKTIFHSKEKPIFISIKLALTCCSSICWWVPQCQIQQECVLTVRNFFERVRKDGSMIKNIGCSYRGSISYRCASQHPHSGSQPSVL